MEENGQTRLYAGEEEPMDPIRPRSHRADSKPPPRVIQDPTLIQAAPYRLPVSGS